MPIMAMAHLQRAGSHRGLYLWVLEVNTAARAFYERLGAEVTDPWLEGLQLDQIKVYEEGKLVDPVYRQSPLAPETWERLQRHPQFAAR